MNNKECMDTLEMCGVLDFKFAYMKRSRKIISENEVKVESLVRICNRYGKQGDLGLCLLIVCGIMKDIRNVEEMQVLYDSFIEILEIYFKYDMDILNYFNESLLYAMDTRLSKAHNKENRNFNDYYEALEICRHISIERRAMIKLDNKQYKIVLNGDNSMSLVDMSGNCFKKDIILMKFYKDKVDIILKNEKDRFNEKGSKHCVLI